MSSISYGTSSSHKRKVEDEVMRSKLTGYMYKLPIKEGKSENKIPFNLLLCGLSASAANHEGLNT
jgi:hypothetical protein